MTLEADARRQSSEKQATWPKNAPHLLEHRRELPFIMGEVQNGAADDRVRRAILPRKGIERAANNLAWRQRRVQGGDELAHRTNSRGVRIHCPHIESVSQEERKITARAAARVQHTLATVESSAKELIERLSANMSADKKI